MTKACALANKFPLQTLTNASGITVGASRFASTASAPTPAPATLDSTQIEGNYAALSSLSAHAVCQKKFISLGLL